MTTPMLPVDQLAVEVDERALAFLLAVVSAPDRVAGVDSGRLLELRRSTEALLAGRDSLESQGLIRDRDDGDHDIDPRLLYLVAVVAGPEVTVEAEAVGRSVTYHAANDQILEIVQVAPDRYELGALTDPTVVVDRIAALVHPDSDGDTSRPDAIVTVDRDRFLEVHDDAGELGQLLSNAGLPDPAPVAARMQLPPTWLVRGEVTATERRVQVAGYDSDLLVVAVDDRVELRRHPGPAATAIGDLVESVGLTP